MCRSLLATIALWAMATLPAHAFEIEAERHFEVERPTSAITILSTTDIALFAPIVTAFQASNPFIDVHYVAASSSEVMKAVVEENHDFDLVISSAMDLQTKLANDGYAMRHSSAAADLVPDWAKWRNSVFAFTQEPATLVLSVQAFEGLAIPQSRQELIAILRANPERFRNRVGTYDVRQSGLGYLFATQDSRTSETFWRLSEVFGQLEPRLYCCSSDMIEDVSTGKIAVAYNALGSYAKARTDLQGSIVIIEPEDFTTLMLRSVIVLKESLQPEAATQFMDHLLTSAWSGTPPKDFPFPSGAPDLTAPNASLRPIRLGPGLLVFLDRFKRAQFIEAWEDAMLQD